jgi:FkbM family methyltransferase
MRHMRQRRRLAAAVLAACRALPRLRGKRRLARAVHTWLDPVPGPRLLRVGSTVFEVTGRDLIEFNLLCEGTGSPEIVAALEALARRGARVFWDVGANIGTIALALAARCPGLEVCAFEPSPQVLALLRRNLALNDALSGRVRLFAAALGDRSGPASFFASGEPRNSGLGGLAQSVNRTALPVTVDVVSGDDLVTQGVAPPPDLLKVDVEGFELEVLRGLERTLRSAGRIALVVEHCVYRLDERSIPRDAVVSWLRALDFELSVVDSRVVPRALAPADLDADHDFLAVKGW